MAFTIVIKEDNEYIFRLLQKRLSTIFQEAYIVKDTSDDLEEDIRMSEFTTCIYNNLTHQSANSDIPMYIVNEDGTSIIDCSSLVAAISKIIGNNSTSKTESSNSKMHLLISYAYINERENTIKQSFQFIKDEADYPIRIDLMSGIRMSSSIKTGLDSGSLTSLLRECNSPKFQSERILHYLNPEINGYLTPGKPDNSDDVFEAGIKSCSKLLKHLRNLTYKDDISIKSLVVVEGFRVSEMEEILTHFDVIHFLLPSRMCDESLGIKSTINSFKLLLKNDQELVVHYCQTISENINETVKT